MRNVRLKAFYDRLPVPGQNLAISAYGWYLRRLRYGEQFEQRVAWWRQVQQLSREERNLLLTRRLRAMVRTAMEHTAYGEQLSSQYGICPEDISHWTDIHQLPILEKSEVRANPDSFISTILCKREVCHIHTSGTTGTPLRVAISVDALCDSYALLGIVESWAGVSRKIPRATFNGRLIVPIEQSEPPYWRYNKPGQQLLFSIYHISPEAIRSYARKLNDYGPAYIEGYPSALYSLARMTLAAGISLPPPIAIRTLALKLYDLQRKTIEEAFKAPIFDWYSFGENCCIAAQCEYGNYHVFDEYGIIEVLKDDRPARTGEEGDIVATSLSNAAMPLIRYRVGDRGVLGSAECPCGNRSTIIESIIGRSDDVVITPEGRIVGRLDFLLFEDASGVAEAQIIQNTPEAVEVLIVTEGILGPEQQNALEAKLRERLGFTIQIKFRIVEKIPRTEASKHKLVESSLNVEDYLSG